MISLKNYGSDASSSEDESDNEKEVGNKSELTMHLKLASTALMVIIWIQLLVGLQMSQIFSISNTGTQVKTFYFAASSLGTICSSKRRNGYEGFGGSCSKGSRLQSKVWRHVRSSVSAIL